MKATVFEGPGQLRVLERPDPRPGPREALIALRACGVCGTDLHIYHGSPGSAPVVPPRVLGHEFAGEVVALGAEVGATTLAVGSRVSIDPNIPCRTCAYCREGRGHLCDRLTALGVTRDGGWAEYCAVPVENCYPVPEGLSWDEAALLEPLGCVLHGLAQLTLRPGATVLVLGGGFIGQLMVQLLALHAPGRLVVSEPERPKREQALAFGAHEAIDPTGRSDEELVGLLGGGADVVVECVGRPGTMELAIKAACKGGQVLLFGVAAPEASIRLSPFEVFRKELVIRGSFINPATQFQALALAQQGKVALARCVSHTWTLAQLPEAIAQYPTLGVLKGLVRF